MKRDAYGDAFRAGKLDAERGFLMADGIRRYAKDKELRQAYAGGYARGVKEIALKTIREIKERKNHEIRG